MRFLIAAIIFLMMLLNTALTFGANIASSATVTASSENTATGQTAVKALDGVVAGYPADASKEWATNHGGAGSWIQLDWPTAQTINAVTLHDRPLAVEQITAATLTFDNGDPVSVPSLPNDGAGLTVNFTARQVHWLRLTVNQVSNTTHNVGLAEIEVSDTAATPAPQPPPGQIPPPTPPSVVDAAGQVLPINSMEILRAGDYLVLRILKTSDLYKKTGDFCAVITWVAGKMTLVPQTWEPLAKFVADNGKPLDPDAQALCDSTPTWQVAPIKSGTRPVYSYTLDILGNKIGDIAVGKPCGNLVRASINNREYREVNIGARIGAALCEITQ